MSCEKGKYSTETEHSRIVNGVGYIEIIPVCVVCPQDTYADTLGSTDCVSCPKYHRTSSVGTTSSKECLGEYALLTQHSLMTLCL